MLATIPIIASEAFPGRWVVTLNLHRSTWHYFTTNPQGGGFGSNHCGSKKVALHKATEFLLAGTVYVLIVNGKISEAVR